MSIIFINYNAVYCFLANTKIYFFFLQLGHHSSPEPDVQLVKKELNKVQSSLPEPTMPPPPPPFSVDARKTLDLDKKINEFKESNQNKPEPIYEAVLINETQKSDDKLSQEINNSETKSNNIIRCNSTVDVNSINQNKTTLKNPSLHQVLKEPEIPTEREQRRKYRVEKKILEMHQKNSDSQKDLYNNEVYYDIMEFAEHYFNVHDKTPEGTIIATLTRKNKKNFDQVPKYEMISFLRADRIPTSHIHMYDPENVVLACNIFRVSISIDT